MKFLSNNFWPFLGLGVSLILPSLGQVQKYLGNGSVLLYIPGVFLVLLISYKWYLKKFISKITERQALWLIAITFIVLIITFFIAYPIVDSGIVGGGSDREDDINVATTNLLHGRYPYYGRTYLGNPLDHFPGILLLSSAFVLLGNSAYQNFFWICVFIFVAHAYLRDTRLVLFLFWMILFLSPVVMQEFVTGGDLISNSIYVLTFALSLVKSVSNPHAKKRTKILFAILLGIGLSSRLIYLPCLLLVFSALVQNSGWKTALKYIGVTYIAFLAVTATFFIYDPKNFTPFHQFKMLNQLRSPVPFSAIILSLVAGIIVLILSFQPMQKDCLALFRNWMILQAILILFVVSFDTIKKGRLSFICSGYGLSFLFFGALAFWYKLTKNKLFDKLI